jgi:hypothetical protein
MSTSVAYIVMELVSAVDAVADVWSLLCTEPDERVSAWLENPERAGGLELRDADLPLVDARTLPQAWAEGRLFGSLGELRWERTSNGALHLVLLAEGDVAIPPGYQEQLMLTRDGDDETIMLWGERQGTSWREERIPHLHYPDKWTQRYAQLIIRHYTADPTPARQYESQFVRYVGFATTNRLARG